jgi:hypothetical protein
MSCFYRRVPEFFLDYIDALPVAPRLISKCLSQAVRSNWSFDANIPCGFGYHTPQAITRERLALPVFCIFIAGEHERRVEVNALSQRFDMVIQNIFHFVRDEDMAYMAGFNLLYHNPVDNLNSRALARHNIPDLQREDIRTPQAPLDADNRGDVIVRVPFSEALQETVYFNLISDGHGLFQGKSSLARRAHFFDAPTAPRVTFRPEHHHVQIRP